MLWLGQRNAAGMSCSLGVHGHGRGWNMLEGTPITRPGKKKPERDLESPTGFKIWMFGNFRSSIININKNI